MTRANPAWSRRWRGLECRALTRLALPGFLGPKKHRIVLTGAVSELVVKAEASRVQVTRKSAQGRNQPEVSRLRRSSQSADAALALDQLTSASFSCASAGLGGVRRRSRGGSVAGRVWKPPSWRSRSRVHHRASRLDGGSFCRGQLGEGTACVLAMYA